ncbi:MAG: 30S ribosomal protein S4e [Methanobacteriota archaeon]|nr:MAG: 30S ribosomal protein S4e [Euryarchaeota archaeon]
MTRRHLKRLAAPRSWKIERKTHTWVVRPRPGKHRLDESLPLLHVVRDILGYADSYREAKRIIKEGGVLVDGRVVRDPKQGVGLMDVVEVPKTKERFVVLVDSAGVLRLSEIKATESKTKLLKIRGKTFVKGGVLQLNLHDGRNILVKPEEAGNYHVHDTIVLNLKDNSIKQHLKYEVGAIVFVTKGSHRGEVARIKEINKIRSPMPNTVVLEKDGREFRTIEDYLIVVGRDKPILSVMKK